jgi:hypothetical protein
VKWVVRRPLTSCCHINPISYATGFCPRRMTKFGIGRFVFSVHRGDSFCKHGHFDGVKLDRKHHFCLQPVAVMVKNTK